MPMLDFRSIDWHDEAERACDGKAPYGRRTAHDIAARMRHAGDQTATAVRCPWGPDPHWHVDRPTLDDLERTAAAIRNRTNEPGDPT